METRTLVPNVCLPATLACYLYIYVHLPPQNKWKTENHKTWTLPNWDTFRRHRMILWSLLISHPILPILVERFQLIAEFIHSPQGSLQFPWPRLPWQTRQACSNKDLASDTSRVRITKPNKIKHHLQKKFVVLKDGCNKCPIYIYISNRIDDSAQ